MGLFLPITHRRSFISPVQPWEGPQAFLALPHGLSIKENTSKTATNLNPQFSDTQRNFHYLIIFHWLQPWISQNSPVISPWISPWCTRKKIPMVKSTGQRPWIFAAAARLVMLDGLQKSFREIFHEPQTSVLGHRADWEPLMAGNVLWRWPGMGKYGKSHLQIINSCDILWLFLLLLLLFLLVVLLLWLWQLLCCRNVLILARCHGEVSN